MASQWQQEGADQAPCGSDGKGSGSLRASLGRYGAPCAVESELPPSDEQGAHEQGPGGSSAATQQASPSATSDAASDRTPRPPGCGTQLQAWRVRQAAEATAAAFEEATKHARTSGTEDEKDTHQDLDHTQQQHLHRQHQHRQRYQHQRQPLQQHQEQQDHLQHLHHMQQLHNLHQVQQLQPPQREHPHHPQQQRYETYDQYLSRLNTEEMRHMHIRREELHQHLLREQQQMAHFREFQEQKARLQQLEHSSVHQAREWEQQQELYRQRPPHEFHFMRLQEQQQQQYSHQQQRHQYPTPDRQIPRDIRNEQHYHHQLHQVAQHPSPLHYPPPHGTTHAEPKHKQQLQHLSKLLSLPLEAPANESSSQAPGGAYWHGSNGRHAQEQARDSPASKPPPPPPPPPAPDGSRIEALGDPGASHWQPRPPVHARRWQGSSSVNSTEPSTVTDNRKQARAGSQERAEAARELLRQLGRSPPPPPPPPGAAPDCTPIEVARKDQKPRTAKDLEALLARTAEKTAADDVADRVKRASEAEGGGGVFLGAEDTAEKASADEDNDVPKENSGRLLLMLLKGSQPEGGVESASGVLPENLNDERWDKARWEPLLQPFADINDRRRFISADSFSPEKGSSVSGIGTQPCVLKDLPTSDLLVYYKPSGWATCSTPLWEGVEGNLIRYVWREHASRAAAPCHRLDRGTSGIVVVAKSRIALRHICMQISDRKIVKQYFGLCRGIISPPSGALSIPLAISSADKPLGACATAGRAAVTRYRVLGYFKSRENSMGYSLVQVQIDHGRQHQIRIHMASIGHPIVSDAKYSGSNLREDLKVTDRLFLHAAAIVGTLPPAGAEPLCVCCRLPLQLRQCLTDTLQRDMAAEEILSAEATQLCDILLMTDPEPVVSTPAASTTDSDSEAKKSDVASKKGSDSDTIKEFKVRDDFLERFSFSAEERKEVLAALDKVTPEEQSSAVSGFQATGERSEVVELFCKHVDALLKCGECRAFDKSSDVGETDFIESDLPGSESGETEGDEDELAEEQDLDEVGPVADTSESSSGPVSFSSKFVKCKVCGEQEKIDRVEFTTLGIRLSCRTSVAPMSDTLMRLLIPDSQRNCYDKSSQWPQWWDRWEDKRWWDEWGDNWQQASWNRRDGKAKNGASPSNDADEMRSSIETQMRSELYAHLKEKGLWNIPGPPVAGLFAIRYNQFLRTDKRRNDGQVRKWIGSQPGVTVQTTGGNQWIVHLDPSAWRKEEERLEAKAEAWDSGHNGREKKADKQVVWKVKAKD
eukprot:TRINITY_DN26966_c0_g1_i1.p1 TRINITY_DN26966_c0_g1~~TRINITY_DN26966_c0_g1_i1.p1  ORF type:complete len:1281 (-),score=213.30 TRINITY_DN26966_c0_g1_i1:39-3860(-)